MAYLYILATPIGNLGDFSLRGLEILKEADLILAEDTRTTKKLLTHYRINKPIISYHQHNHLTRAKYIFEQLGQGQKMVLVSEAGTPGISDPGAKLIDYLIDQLPGLRIVPIPGPSALIAALSISGLSADKFIFLGFPPAKKKRKKFFEEVARSKYTAVFYESPHRITKTLSELAVILNLPETAKESCERRLVVCRELTKKFETVYRGQIKEVIKQIKNPPTGGKIKGEFVIVVSHK
jgi:16S rRNA (cytidine1402-2'-O)-methyltransferase